MDSELNNVDYNIELLETSDINRNIFYIAGHSGNGDNCYFNRVRELVIGNYIYIYFDSKSLVYEVVEIYNIVKSGVMEVSDEENVLYLITCDIYNDNRQLIVKSKLI